MAQFFLSYDITDVAEFRGNQAYTTHCDAVSIMANNDLLHNADP